MDWTETVERCRDGDQKAWRLVVNETQHNVRRSAASVWKSDQTVIDDIAQESYVLAFEKLSQLRDPSRFVQWISKIARNVAVRWQRADFVQLPLTEETTAAEVAEADQRAQLRAMLRELVCSLETKQRKAKASA